MGFIKNLFARSRPDALQEAAPDSEFASYGAGAASAAAPAAASAAVPVPEPSAASAAADSGDAMTLLARMALTKGHAALVSGATT